MYCPKCGTENPDGAKVCRSCSWVLKSINKHFNINDVLGYGWRVMKANLWFFVGLGFLFMIISYLPGIARFIVKSLNLPKATDITLAILLQILGWLIKIVLGIGLIKIALSFCDGRKPLVGMLFDAWDCFWRYVGTAILYGLIIFGILFPCIFAAILLRLSDFPWLLLLIVPVGVVFAVRFAIQFGLCFYFVIDEGLGPIEALKASSRTTMGVKGRLLGFYILCGLINLLGFLCLIVGMFATYPTVLVAGALVYRQLLAQTPELAEFGIGGSDDIQANPNWAP